MRARGGSEALNLLALGAQAVASPTLGPNVVADADCEKVGTADWTAVNATLTKEAGDPSGVGGSKVIRAARTGANPSARQTCLAANTLYQFEGWCRPSAGGTPAGVVRGSTFVLQYPHYPSSTAWQRFLVWHRGTGTTLDYRTYNNVGAWAEFDNLVAKTYASAQIAGLQVSHAAVEYALISALGIVPITYDGPCFSDDGIRNHHATTQLMLQSSTTFGGAGAWGLLNLVRSLGMSESLAQPVALFKETAIVGSHTVYGTLFCAASAGSHVFTFYAAAAGRTSVLVRLALAAGNVDTVVNLTSSLARYTISFTTTAGDVGVNKVVTFYLRDAGGNTSYLGDVTKGAYVDLCQAEAGDIPTPYIPSWGAAVSGIAPVYNITDDRLLWRLGSAKAIEPEVELKWLYALPAGVTSAPIWTIEHSSGFFCSLKWVPGGACFSLVHAAGTDSISTTWTPTAGRIYDIRTKITPSGATNYVEITIIDRTANTVTTISSTTRFQVWPMPLRPEHYWIGCDQTMAGQWNSALREVRA